MEYDVFISCKSEDYAFAEQVYSFLTANGIHTFLATKELRNLGDSEYRRSITGALKSAYHLIVFASRAEYVDSIWVYYEWDLFLNAKLKGYKKGQILTVLKDVKVDDINMDLWKYESFTFYNYKDGLLDYVETPNSLARRETENKSSIFLSHLTRRKPIMNVFLMFDCSGSMYGERIERMNTTFAAYFDSFEIANPDIEIRVNAIEFSTSAKWMYPLPVSVEEFKWLDLQAAGLTSMGEAFKLLNEAMDSRQAFCNTTGQDVYLDSLVLLISDGCPTDDYVRYLKLLQNNPRFLKSKRIAIGLGDAYDHNVLEQFTGNSKKVFHVDDFMLDTIQPLVNRLMTMNLYALSAAALDE